MSGPNTERSIVLEQGRTEKSYWSDLWTYRELFAILAWRDVAVQYKQAVIGAGWAVIRPLLTLIIFSVVFGRIAKLPTEGEAPYPIMVMAGMLAWFLFSSGLSQSANSLVSNSNLISKVYFPRIIVPAAATLVAIVDFGITLGLMVCMMIWMHSLPDWRVLFLPIFAALAILASLGPGLLMASLNVKYRDFRFIVPFVVQFGLYASPVGYSTTVIPEEWRFWAHLNPVVGIIDGFRWSLLGEEKAMDWAGLGLSVAVIALFLVIGVAAFRSTERTFADLI